MTNQLALSGAIFDGLDERQRSEWQRFMGELIDAVKTMDLETLREWGKKSLSIAWDTTAARVKNLYGLIRAAVSGAWDEFKRLWSSIWNGEFTQYAKDACNRAWRWLRKVGQEILNMLGVLRSAITTAINGDRDTMLEVVAAFTGAIIGFVIMGGRGDGGVIDGDIAAFGLGGHRSIFFHSLTIGLGAEIFIKSSFELMEILYTRLPKDHSVIWERSRKIGTRFRDALVAGSWAGVAAHLTIDSHIGGWTPYKDIPVVLPNWGHHMLMDMSAASSGWFAWQWYDKVKRRFRDNSFAQSTIDGVRCEAI